MQCTMRYPGILTDKLSESKQFYTALFNFQVMFDSDWFILLQAPDNPGFGLAFLLPNHETQQPLFQPAFAGQGMFLSMEVADVDAEYERLKAQGAEIIIDIRDEPWGDRHFSLRDPNGVGVDIVTHQQPE